MRKLGTLVSGLFVVSCLALSPLAAHAGLIVEGSVGKGRIVDPVNAWAPTNVMLAPGVTLVGTLVRLQLGLAAELPDVENSKFDLQFRPMLTVKPPILPIHGRAIVAVQNLTHDATFAFGAAGGLNLSLFGIGVFAEAGLLPTVKNSDLIWVVEGRIGASLAF